VGTIRLWGLRGAPARTSLGAEDRSSRHAPLFGLDNLRLGAQCFYVVAGDRSA
jgi:hypothetical protein